MTGIRAWTCLHYDAGAGIDRGPGTREDRGTVGKRWPRRTRCRPVTPCRRQARKGMNTFRFANAMHITASVFINDNEPGLHADYKKWLEELAPFDPSPERYAHNRTGEDNADAHHKRQIMGREVVVAITKGKLDFGAWEQIFYGEFDGKRPKRVLVKIIGE